MDDMQVYVSDGDGHHSEDLEAFIGKVISGDMTDAYNQRFGHFGPRGVMGQADLPPQAPTELEDLDQEDSEPVAGDAWE